MEKPKYNIVMHALRIFKLTIGDEDQDQLVAKLKQFAKANGFTYLSSQVQPDPHYMMIVMKRNDFSVTANNPFTPGGFEISFDPNAPNAPAVPKATLDTVEQSLKSFLPALQRDR